MKAPDKIFLHKVRDEESSGYHKMWFESRGRLVPSEEYIRKDALLEWAKEKYNEYKQMDEDFQGDVFIGNRHAFAEVIAKIESL